jgi:hypothetical protein
VKNKEAEKVLKYKKKKNIRNMAHVKYKYSDTRKKKGNWNHLTVLQTISEQHTGKTCNQRTKQNSHIGHCPHTSESTNVEVQNIQHGIYYYTCHKLYLQNSCKTLNPRNVVYLRYIILNALRKR